MNRFIFLLIAFIFSSCSTAVLSIRPCVPDSLNHTLYCSDKDGNKSELDFKEADNYVCFDNEDLRTIYESCKKAPVNVFVCIINIKDYELNCADKDGKTKDYELTDIDDFTCFSKEDTRSIFEYCAKK